jgi:hypothetical protein
MRTGKAKSTRCHGAAGAVQMKFILAVIAGELIISNRKRAAIEADLEAGGYDRMSKSDSAGKRGIAVAAEPEDGDGEEAAAEADREGKSFDYLLSMAISSLTYEKAHPAARACCRHEQTQCSLFLSCPGVVVCCDADVPFRKSLQRSMIARVNMLQLLAASEYQPDVRHLLRCRSSSSSRSRTTSSRTSRSSRTRRRSSSGARTSTASKPRMASGSRTRRRPTRSSSRSSSRRSAAQRRRVRPPPPAQILHLCP